MTWAHLTYWQKVSYHSLEHLLFHHLYAFPITQGDIRAHGVKQKRDTPATLSLAGRELLSISLQAPSLCWHSQPNRCVQKVLPQPCWPMLLWGLSPGLSRPFLLSSLTLIIWRKLIYQQLHSLQFGHKWLSH